ncbi:sigma E factor positive regulatory protein RseC [Psychromonas marina]|uniref:Sigma E factor positive regulatory protein RseC n=1 Tax=Psychromonas marina TaxID=88364 RepID=A0ABQ6E5Q9_9GAMM|nr:SoxR reducing system RseC family protein [Psychromonas marina]GLS92650.1 sigma E factor positive regulatory protein RseC [Psychromonas marina]
MITETGKIIAIEEVQGEIVARVECISKSACSSCNNNTSCGVGVVSKAFSDKSHSFELPYKEGMKVDTFIELNISNGDLIKSATLIYLLPLVFFIGSALLIKSTFMVNEGILIALSAVSAALGFAITRLIANKLFPHKQSKPLIKTKYD